MAARRKPAAAAAAQAAVVEAEDAVEAARLASENGAEDFQGALDEATASINDLKEQVAWLKEEAKKTTLSLAESQTNKETLSQILQAQTDLQNQMKDLTESSKNQPPSSLVPIQEQVPIVEAPEPPATPAPAAPPVETKDKNAAPARRFRII